MYKHKNSLFSLICKNHCVGIYDYHRCDRHTEVFSLLLDLKNNFNFFYKFWIGLGIGLFFSVKKNLSIFESLKTIYQNRDDFSIILKPKRYFWWENYLRTFLFFIRPKERSLMAQWQQIENKREKTTAKIGDLVLVWTVDKSFSIKFSS